MNQAAIALSKARLAKAKEDLCSAERALKDNELRTSANRSYYAVFHAMRAVNSLDGYDSKKHSGVIQHFNYEHIHQHNDFPDDTYRLIDDVKQIRQISDYDDFYICSKSDAEEQLESAKLFLSQVEDFLKTIDTETEKESSISDVNSNEKSVTE
ncbi:MAG: HEPN domain-containing protein [Lachnospiraceae bacterium]|nr:HEPN domain-containing protein [Lachnospiraceae bacterium]